MGANFARRRAAKAVPRRQILAQRRAATAVSLAEKVRRLADRPLYRCFLHGEPFNGGIATVFLTRVAKDGEIAMAAFLVDTYALGIKDVVFQLIERSEFEEFVSMAGAAAPVIPTDPAYARKLLRDAKAYAASLGLRPHRNFAAVEQLFGDVRAEECAEAFVFGREGKPFYAVGPTETAGQIGRRLARLAERLGPDGFDFMIPLEGDEYISNVLVGAPAPEEETDAA
jgi:hypothetical protein